jgi:hypothetical protein
VHEVPCVPHAHGGRRKKILRGAELVDSAIYSITCEDCLAYIFTQDGKKSRKRLAGEVPVCARCPKFKFRDALEDDRIMHAVMLSRLPIPENDPIIRSNSWLFFAVTYLRAKVAQRDQARAQTPEK